jgi:cytochrome c-type biogenesis protein CcmH/NrfF
MLAATPAARAQTMPHTGTVHIDSDAERSLFSSLRCMCGSCPRDLLSTCPCTSADEARDNIRAKLRAGETRDRIIAEYAEEYGAEALAVPPNRGVLRAIWLVPMVSIALGALGVARLVRRWRGGAGVSRDGAPRGRKSDRAAKDAYDSRLDEELKDLDD